MRRALREVVRQAERSRAWLAGSIVVGPCGGKGEQGGSDAEAEWARAGAENEARAVANASDGGRITKANTRRLSTINLLPLVATSEDDYVMVIVLAAAVSLTLAGLLSRLCLAGLLWALVAADRRQSRLNATGA